MTAPEDPSPPEGTVAGKYRLVRLLGRGGMGAVWEGIHETLGTKVAVKFIDTEYASSDDVRLRFVNEAKAAARLRSKHVVQVYDQGVGEDGRPYIVMEFLPGEPLDRRLARLGRLSPAETARVVLHVSRALQKAHDSGIVHRDLKPENVFLVHDEEDATDIAKVVDFGIAKFTDPSGPGSSSTRTGAVLGTPQYMSPEQARGLRSVDRRTDLWSLGVIVYQCLTGKLPFKGEAVGDLLVNICTADAPVPSSIAADVPPGFDAWVRRALAREPSDRFQTVAELCDSLAQVCGADVRLGAAASTRELAPSTPEVDAPSAVTGAPLSTTHDPSRRRGRPSWALLSAVFLLVTVSVAVIARAMMHAGPEVAAQVSPASSGAASAAVGTPSASTEPRVTPSVSPPPAPSSLERGPPPERSVRPRLVRAPAPVEEKPRAPAPGAPPAKPAKHVDELGY